MAKNNKKIKKTVKKENINSRVTRNQELYSEDLTITKQQQFEFKDLHLENTLDLDTSFVDKKIKQKKQPKIKIKEDLTKPSLSKEKKTLSKNKEKNIYKKLVITLFTLLIIFICLTVLHFITFNHHKVKIVTETVEKVVNDENIIFLGDSITHRYDLQKYFKNHNTVNSGEEGNQATNILDNMYDRIYRYNPSKIFLLIGTNDLDESTNLSVKEVFDGIKKICEQINENRPNSSIYIESLLPVNENVIDSPAKNKSNDKINEINKLLKDYCNKKNYTYINTHDQLLDEDNHLGIEYTKDGLHLTDEGYKVISEIIKEYL